MITDSEKSREALEAFNADMDNIAKLHDIKRLDALRDDAVQWANQMMSELRKLPGWEELYDAGHNAD